MNVINQSEFDKTIKKYNAIKNDEVGILDDINKSFTSLSLMYSTNQNVGDINISLNNKIISIKSLHDNSFLYLQRVYDEQVSAYKESSSILENIDVDGGIR